MARRIALVTGANRGIGFEVARQLVQRGLAVVLSGRDEAAVREAAARAGAEPEVLDVSDGASVREAARRILARHGRLDVLVNNAGVALDESDAALDADDATVRATMETNLLGAWRCCRAFVPGMVERRYGRVVNVSSGAGSLAEMGGYAPSYSVSKAALNGFTRLLAQDLEGTNVKVNAACPGWVRTDMGGPAAPRSVEEGADTIVWLATLPDDGPTNGFWRDRAPAAW